MSTSRRPLARRLTWAGFIPGIMAEDTGSPAARTGSASLGDGSWLTSKRAVHNLNRSAAVCRDEAFVYTETAARHERGAAVASRPMRAICLRTDDADDDINGGDPRSCLVADTALWTTPLLSA